MEVECEFVNAEVEMRAPLLAWTTTTSKTTNSPTLGSTPSLLHGLIRIVWVASIGIGSTPNLPRDSSRAHTINPVDRSAQPADTLLIIIHRLARLTRTTSTLDLASLARPRAVMVS